MIGTPAALRSLGGDDAVKTLWRVSRGPAAAWFAWLLLAGGYAYVRALGAHSFEPHNIEHLEGWLPGPIATRALQISLFDHGTYWLDYTCYLLHGFWFGLPFGFGLIVMIWDRRKLPEFLVWTLVPLYVAAIFFIAFPVRPPWMEPGIQRVMVVRGFGGYTGLDDNPYAAFPSLHAAAPATMALFFFVRCPRLRFCGWIAAGFALAIGFAVVYLGEHWVLDVLAGYTLAGAIALCLCSKRLRHIWLRVPIRGRAAFDQCYRWLFPVEVSPKQPPAAEPEPLPRAA